MPTIRTLNAEVVGDTLNLQEQETDLATTPLAEVPTDTALDSIIGVKDGAVRKVSVGDIPYDNTESGLTADTVQGAIDEVVDKVEASLPYHYTSGSVSMASSEITYLCSFTIPSSGLWLLMSRVYFNSSFDQVYNHYLFWNNNNIVVRGNMTSGGGTLNATVGIFSEGTVIRVGAYHTTGSARVATAELSLVRLGNA